MGATLSRDAKAPRRRRRVDAGIAHRADRKAVGARLQVAIGLRRRALAEGPWFGPPPARLSLRPDEPALEARRGAERPEPESRPSGKLPDLRGSDPGVRAS